VPFCNVFGLTMLFNPTIAFLDPMPDATDANAGIDSYGDFNNGDPEESDRWIPNCLQAEGPTGIYWVSGREVVCDTVTDGGGWTLVYSGSEPPYDYGGPWHEGLTTLRPTRGGPRSLWWELQLSPSVSDFRTSCALEPCHKDHSCLFDVDLAFKNTLWYNNIASGLSDAETCFGIIEITSRFLAPERCNLLTGECELDFWKSGEFQGEKRCDSVEDFTVDFDDRGMDSDEADGTDWGLDDGVWKCGRTACHPLHGNCSWFIWVRGSSEGKDLFDRIFGVQGWFQLLFYALGVATAAILPCFALCCARCCFHLAAQMANTGLSFDESIRGRPRHSEGNYPHYIIQTRVEEELTFYDDLGSACEQ